LADLPCSLARPVPAFSAVRIFRGRAPTCGTYPPDLCAPCKGVGPVSPCETFLLPHPEPAPCRPPRWDPRLLFDKAFLSSPFASSEVGKFLRYPNSPAFFGFFPLQLGLSPLFPTCLAARTLRPCAYLLPLNPPLPPLSDAHVPFSENCTLFFFLPGFRTLEPW